MQTDEEMENSPKITIVESDIKANFILKEILNSKPCAIAIDCEAALEMSRFGILCLIQVIYFISLRLLSRIRFLS